MHWNIAELQKRVISLENASKTINNPKELVSIKQDILTLKRMIDYINGIKKNASSYVTDEHRKKDINNDYLLSYLPYLSDALTRFNNYIHLPWQVTFDKTITEQEYCKLLNEFTESFSREFYIFFRKMVLSEHIELNKQKYSDSFCKGLAYPIASTGKPFVSARFNGHVKTTSFLLHELAHAFQMCDVTDYDKINSMLYSPLREAFPIFIELLFLDFLKQTKYRKNAFAIEYDKLDSFLISFEYIYPKVLQLKDAKMINGTVILQSGDIISNKEYTMLLSFAFAFYMLDLYRNDKKEAIKFIEMFNVNYKNALELMWLNFVNANSLVVSSQSVMSNYIRNYNKK